MSQKIQNQSTAAVPPPTPKPSAAEDAGVQGEGDYAAARRYRQDVMDFLARAHVEEIADRAAPQSALEARELALAAERGQQRSKGDDPADVGAMYPGRDNGKP